MYTVPTLPFRETKLVPKTQAINSVIFNIPTGVSRDGAVSGDLWIRILYLLSVFNIEETTRRRNIKFNIILIIPSIRVRHTPNMPVHLAAILCYELTLQKLRDFKICAPSKIVIFAPSHNLRNEIFQTQTIKNNVLQQTCENVTFAQRLFTIPPFSTDIICTRFYVKIFDFVTTQQFLIRVYCAVSFKKYVFSRTSF